MKLENYTEDVRKQICKSYMLEAEFKTAEFREKMLLLRNHSFVSYRDLLCILYPTFYMMNERRSIDREDLMFDIQDDYDVEEDEENFEEIMYEDTAYIYDLSDIKTPDDLIKFMDDNDDALAEMLTCICLFERMSYLEKRRTMNLLIGFDGYFMRFNPYFLNDKYEYTHEINKDEFLVMIEEAKSLRTDSIPERFIRIDEADEFLADMEIADFDNYQKLLKQIYNDSYKYQKYLLLKKQNTSESTWVSSNVDAIERLDMFESPYFLNLNLDFFFEFNSKSKEFKDEVYKFFDENKQHNKIKIKINEQH